VKRSSEVLYPITVRNSTRYIPPAKADSTQRPLGQHVTIIYKVEGAKAKRTVKRFDIRLRLAFYSTDTSKLLSFFLYHVAHIIPESSQKKRPIFTALQEKGGGRIEFHTSQKLGPNARIVPSTPKRCRSPPPISEEKQKPNQSGGWRTALIPRGQE
jgi:hypothetical protein